MSDWLPVAVPDRVRIASLGVEFVALTPMLLEQDYAAVMRDIQMLRDWSAQGWPTAEFTKDENLEDLQRHDREQRERIALTYSVVVDGMVCGCIYVRPFVDALRTREIEPPTTTKVPATDAVARGWAHDITAEHLITATRLLLMLPPFDFTRIWWQTNTSCPDQIEACEQSGLIESLTFVGATATWTMHTTAAVPHRS
jgi:hypothetical protein